MACGKPLIQPSSFSSSDTYIERFTKVSGAYNTFYNVNNQALIIDITELTVCLEYLSFFYSIPSNEHKYQDYVALELVGYMGLL